MTQTVIEGLAPAAHEAVAQVNALEAAAYGAEGEASDLRWQQAEWVACALAEGLSTRKLAALWTNPETGEPYSRAHVRWVAATCMAYGHLSAHDRPRWNTAYNSDEVRKASDRYDRNRRGAHEGLDLAVGDAGGDDWTLLLGDLNERLSDLPDGSVDAIITDPPYPASFLALFDDLGTHAARLLARGGVLAARCGHIHLPGVLDRLAAHLAFGWVYAEPLPGSNVRFLGRKIAVAWQPWVAFSNGPWPSGRIDWHPDLLAESPRTKSRYVWEQKPSVAAELTATLAPAGATVLDPFAGSGSYGEAALGVGCRWVGVEVDPAGHAQAARRLEALA